MRKKLLRPWIITLVISLIYTGWILYLGHGNPLVFAEIGTRFSEGDPNGTEGYDGQFFYYIAVDPATAPQKIDVPAYRFQRILYPLVARFLSLNQVSLIPWILIIINLAGLVGSVWLTEQLLAQHRVNIWHALPVGLFVGQLLSIRVDLPEPLALALVLLGIWLFEYEQEQNSAGRISKNPRLWSLKAAWLWSVLFFTLAVFTKETMLISGLAYALYLLSQKELKKSIIFGFILVIPFSIYQLYLYFWLGHFGISSGGVGATPFELIPFGGLFSVAQVSWPAFWLFLLILGPIVILPALWSLYATGQDILARQWHPWTLALGLNALIILFLPNSTWREPLAMLRFSVLLVALLILYSAQTKRWRALSYSYLWLCTLAFIIREPLL